MSIEQLSILRCAMWLKSALDIRTAAKFLRDREVPVTIAVMVLCRSGSSMSPKARG